jgi:4-hydroxy-3-methylbut-2-enyl diphosphate reductase
LARPIHQIHKDCAKSPNGKAAGLQSSCSGLTDINWADFEGVPALGLTAGASAPETLVEEIISAFDERFDVTVEIVRTAEETIAFNLPRELRDMYAQTEKATG